MTAVRQWMSLPRVFLYVGSSDSDLVGPAASGHANLRRRDQDALGRACPRAGDSAVVGHTSPSNEPYDVDPRRQRS